LPELDPIVHGQLRLAVLSLLAGVEEADLKWWRGKTRSTDGNLGPNLTKLEEAKYHRGDQEIHCQETELSLQSDFNGAQSSGIVHQGPEALAG